jgi:uncharacterized protein involved in response to NO
MVRASIPIRRAERPAMPPVLQHGFRPFFFLGALWAALALFLWLGALAGAVTLPTAMDPAAWHRHEMLFGYLAAIVAAFLLTAVPNWTGRLPVRGAPLAGLVALWALGRLAVLTSGWVGAVPALALDVAFPVVFAAVAAREVAAGGNRRNMPVVALVGLLALASLLSHLGSQGALPAAMLGDRLAIAVAAMLVALIGGRIVPSFTTNWLKARAAASLPAPFGRLDKAVLALTGLALLAWLARPEGAAAGLLLLAAAAGTALRLARWRGAATVSEPLLLVLHLGHAWLALGLAMLGLAALGLVPRSAALHAVTAGAFGTMTLAVMTRAALGHTGRALTADGWTVAVYALVNVGALARLAAVWAPQAYLPVLDLAGLAWGGAFLLYAARYAPVLLGPPRSGSRPVAAPGGPPGPKRRQPA